MSGNRSGAASQAGPDLRALEVTAGNKFFLTRDSVS